MIPTLDLVLEHLVSKDGSYANNVSGTKAMIHMRAGTNTDPGLYVLLVNDVVYVYYNGADIPNGGPY